MQSTEYRDVLTSLCCDANMMRDSAFADVRDTAIRMLALIDGALSVVPTEPKLAGIDAVPSRLLLREIEKRMRAVRHVRKLCTKCKSRPVRARDLCAQCYKKAYRRGEIT